MFAPSRRRTFSDRAPERCSRVERFEPVTAALRLLSSPSSRLASSGGRAARPVPCRRPSLPPAPELRKSRETVSLRPSVFADTRYRRPGARHGKVGHRHPTEHQPRRAELAPNHRQRERLRVEPLYHVAPPNPHEPRPSATASPARRRAPELSQDVNVPTSSTSFLSEIQHAKPSARADGPIEHEVNDVPRLSVPRTSPVPPTKATSRIGRYLGSLRGAFQHDLAGRSANAAKSGRGARKGRGGDHGRGRLCRSRGQAHRPRRRAQPVKERQRRQRRPPPRRQPPPRPVAALRARTPEPPRQGARGVRRGALGPPGRLGARCCNGQVAQ